MITQVLILVRLIREALSRSGSLSADEQNASIALEHLFDHPVSNEVKALLAAAKAAISSIRNAVTAAALEVKAGEDLVKAFDDETRDFTEVIREIEVMGKRLKAASAALHYAGLLLEKAAAAVT
jgi:2-polyprenyl-3-methyl-5-hydroxy-6-metoxy-1,4-benzoquinol methylase